MKYAPEVVAGDVHNRLLGATSDSTNGFRVIPGLMLSLLRDGGWKRLVRPIDNKEFHNETIEQWILGEPWAGLHFPNWDSLYAMLDRSEHGEECKRLLIELGAPANGWADIREASDSKRPSKGTKLVPLSKGGTDRAVARMKRDNPELAEQVIAGRISAHAAAVQAGIRKPTWTAPDDPELLAKKIGQRYPGWKMVKEE